MSEEYIVMGKTTDHKGKEHEFKPLKVEADNEQQAIMKAVIMRYEHMAALHSTDDMIALTMGEYEFTQEMIGLSKGQIKA